MIEMSTSHRKMCEKKKRIANVANEKLCRRHGLGVGRSVPTGIRKTVMKNYFLATPKIYRFDFVYNVNVAVDAETQSYTDTARESRRDTRTSVCRCAVRPSHTTAARATQGKRYTMEAYCINNILLAHINRLEVGLYGRLKEIRWRQRQQQQHRPIHSERQKYVVDIGVVVMACDLYIYMNIYLISSHRIARFLLARAHTFRNINFLIFILVVARASASLCRCIAA